MFFVSTNIWSLTEPENITIHSTNIWSLRDKNITKYSTDCWSLTDSKYMTVPSTTDIRSLMGP